MHPFPSHLLLRRRIKRLLPPPIILNHSPPLNILLNLLAPILLTRHRLPPRPPIRHNPRPRLLHQLRILQIRTILTRSPRPNLRRSLTSALAFLFPLSLFRESQRSAEKEM